MSCMGSLASPVDCGVLGLSSFISIRSLIAFTFVSASEIACVSRSKSMDLYVGSLLSVSMRFETVVMCCSMDVLACLMLCSCVSRSLLNKSFSPVMIDCVSSRWQNGHVGISSSSSSSSPLLIQSVRSCALANAAIVESVFNGAIFSRISSIISSEYSDCGF